MSGSTGIRRAMYVVTGASLLVPLVGVVTAPILAHALGVVGRGEVATALAPNSLVVSVATLGLPEALTFELARRPGLTKRMLVFTTTVSLALGALCLALAAVFASVLTNGSPELSELLLIATALAIPTLLVNILRGAAMGRQMWGAVAGERTLNAVLRLVVLGGLALAGQLTVTSAVLVSAIGPILAAVAYWRLFLPEPTAAQFRDAPVAAPLMGFGFRVWIGAVASMLYGRMSSLVITPLSNVRELGLFIVAITISDMPLLVANAVRDVIFGVNARDADIDQLTAASRVMTIIGFAGSLVLGAILPWCIVPLFGTDFYAAMVPAWILLAAGVIGIPSLIAGAGLGAWNRPTLRSMIIVASLVANTVALVVFVPTAGAVGAAWAGIVSAVVASTFGVVAMARVARVNPLVFVVPRRSDFALIVREGTSVVRRVVRKPRQEHATAGSNQS